LLGGLVAGVVFNAWEYVLNLVVMRQQWQSAMSDLGRNYPTSGQPLVLWVGWAFLAGILVTWLYALARARFGPGVRTAAIAGATAWCLDCLLIAIAFANLGLLPAGMITILTAAALPEHVLAAIAGAWVYREEANTP